MKINLRSIEDFALNREGNLPAAGASASTGVLDVGPAPVHFGTRADLVVSVDALPELEDGKKATTVLEHSADNVTFSAVPGLAPIVQTGAGGNGAAAASQRYRPGSDLLQYIRATTSVEAAGGNNSAAKVRLTPKF